MRRAVIVSCTAAVSALHTRTITAPSVPDVWRSRLRQVVHGDSERAEEPAWSMFVASFDCGEEQLLNATMLRIKASTTDILPMDDDQVCVAEHLRDGPPTVYCGEAAIATAQQHEYYLTAAEMLARHRTHANHTFSRYILQVIDVATADDHEFVLMEPVFDLLQAANIVGDVEVVGKVLRHQLLGLKHMKAAGLVLPDFRPSHDTVLSTGCLAELTEPTCHAKIWPTHRFCSTVAQSHDAPACAPNDFLVDVAYLSPEFYAGRVESELPSLWAAGVGAFEALSGTKIRDVSSHLRPSPESAIQVQTLITRAVNNMPSTPVTKVILGLLQLDTERLSLDEAVAMLSTEEDTPLETEASDFLTDDYLRTCLGPAFAPGNKTREQRILDEQEKFVAEQEAILTEQRDKEAAADAAANKIFKEENEDRDWLDDY